MNERKAALQQTNLNWLRFRNIGRNLGVASALLVAAACSPTDKDAATSTPVHELNASAAASGTPTAGNTRRAVPAESCQWANKDGKRQPPIDTKPVTVRVDGTCDPDPAAPIGLYPTAEQVGGPIATVNTDDTLTVHCYVTNAQPIQDARGGAKEGDQFIASSPVWLDVTTQDGVRGKVSEVWEGFPGIATLGQLGVRECA